MNCPVDFVLSNENFKGCKVKNDNLLKLTRLIMETISYDFPKISFEKISDSNLNLTLEKQPIRIQGLEQQTLKVFQEKQSMLNRMPCNQNSEQKILLTA
eukprot:Pgem_evm1s18806